MSISINNVKPISPNEIMENLEKIISPIVIEAVNNLLKKKFRGSEVTIKQKDIEREILRLDNTITHAVLMENKWLDFESLFNENGWIVTYEKSSYGDREFDAYYNFKPKK